MKTTLRALGIAGALLAVEARAALIEGVSYAYTNSGDLNGIAGKDIDGAATPQALTDGLGLAGDYTPSATFWGSGQEGTIYLEDNANIENGQPQPAVVFDLGVPHFLNEVVIHYGVLQASAVLAPVAVEVDIDSAPLGTFMAFDLSENASSFGDIRSLAIDFSGMAGQTVEMRFLGDISDLGRAGQVSRVGLTEVSFDGVRVPEPNGLAVAVAVMGLRSRRLHWRRAPSP